MEEPVEIDLRLKQDLDTEGRKASESIDDIAKSSQKAKEELQENIAIQKKVLKELRAELELLKAAFAKVNVGTQDPKVIAEREKLSKAVRELTAEINAEEKALTELEKRSQQVTTKQAQLRTQIMNIKDDMVRLKLEGRENTAEYAKMEKQLELLGTAYRELNQTQKALTTGGTQMAGLLSGMSALSGALAAGAGAYGLMTGESEKFQKIQTKVQSLMAITIGLQQISNTLHKTSAFRITTVRKAKELWTIASTKLAVALGISNVAAQALMATLTLGLSVAITAVIAAIGTFTKKQREAAEEMKKFNDSVAEEAGKTLIVYEKLQRQYKALNNDIKSQTKFLEDNKDGFKQLGIVINNVNDADNAFINNADAFRESVKERAKALAAMKIASEKYEEIVKLEMQLAEMPEKTTKMVYQGQYRATLATEVDNPEIDKIRNKINESEAVVNRLVTVSIESETKAAEKLKEAGLNNAETIEEGTKAWWEALQKSAKDRLAGMTEMEQGSEKWNKAVIDYNLATEKLKAWDLSKKTTKKEESKKDKASESLRKMAVDLQHEIDAATIAAMQEGAEKKLEQIDSEYEKRKSRIKARKAEIEELEQKTGIPATGNREQLARLAEAEKAKYEAARKAVEDAAKAEVDAVFADVNERFNTGLQNQLNRINEYYNQQLVRVRENVTETDRLNRLSTELEDKRLRELGIAREEYALHTINFEEDIALKRQEIANRELMWESDKQKKLLQIQLDASLKRLRALNNIKIQGGDAEEEIKRLRLEIERLNIELGKTDSAKLKEITTLLKNSIEKIASSLGEMPGTIGDIGEALAGLAGNADNIATILDETSSKTDIISAGVNGLVSLFEMVAGQIAKNKEMQAEWNDKIREAAHQAALARIELEAYREGNIFGIENPYSKAIAGANEYAAAMGELNEAAGAFMEGQVQIGIKKVFSGKNFLKGALSGGLAGAIAGLFTKEVVPVFKSLAKQYGEIYDKETFELNPKILQDIELLDEGTKKIVRNWEEIRKKALEAEQQMRDTFRELAGDIGNQLSSALVNAFRNNDLTSAMNQFEDSVGKMVENIISQMVFATYFQDMINELGRKMDESFGIGKDADPLKHDEDIVDDLMWFIGAALGTQDSFNHALAEVKKEAKEKYGIDLFQPDARTGMSKGIAQASQDTVDELNGRITNIQQMIYDIRSNGSASLNVNNEILNHQRLIRSQVDTIAENSQHLKRLEKIENSLSDISLRGIKIKQ